MVLIRVEIEIIFHCYIFYLPRKDYFRKNVSKQLKLCYENAIMKAKGGEK